MFEASSASRERTRLRLEIGNWIMFLDRYSFYNSPFDLERFTGMPLDRPNSLTVHSCISSTVGSSTVAPLVKCVVLLAKRGLLGDRNTLNPLEILSPQFL